MKRTDNYASNQIRILLHELKNPSHKIKVKAIETFRSYIETYQPDVSGGDNSSYDNDGNGTDYYDDDGDGDGDRGTATAADDDDDDKIIMVMMMTMMSSVILPHDLITYYKFVIIIIFIDCG